MKGADGKFNVAFDPFGNTKANASQPAPNANVFQDHWNSLEHHGFSQNDPIRHYLEKENLTDGDPFAIQILKNSKHFRNKTGFAPRNHRIAVAYGVTRDIDDNLTIDPYV